MNTFEELIHTRSGSIVVLASVHTLLFLIPFSEEDNRPKFVLIFSSTAQNNHVLSASVNHYWSLKEFLESPTSIQSLGGEATYKSQELEASSARKSASRRQQPHWSGQARLCCSNKEALTLQRPNVASFMSHSCKVTLGLVVLWRSFF